MNEENHVPASGTEQGETNVEGSIPTLDIDYKAELERERKRVEQAEFTIRKLKAERKEEDTLETPQIDEATIEQIVERKLAGVTKIVQQTSAKELARSKARTTEEADLILHHYEHSIIPTGDLSEDIENAWVLANKKRLTDEAEEAKRALLARSNRANVSGAGQRPKTDAPIRLNPEQEKLMRAYGLTPEELLKNQ